MSDVDRVPTPKEVLARSGANCIYIDENGVEAIGLTKDGVVYTLYGFVVSGVKTTHQMTPSEIADHFGSALTCTIVESPGPN